MTSCSAIQVAIHNVLLATDFSHSSYRAARLAVALSHVYDAKLYLVHVVNAGETIAAGENPDKARETARVPGELWQSHLAREVPLADVDHGFRIA